VVVRVNAEWLTEREVLNDQFVTSAAGQCQRPDGYKIISIMRGFCRSTRGDSTVTRPV
jgi:hypothetical protein